MSAERTGRIGGQEGSHIPEPRWRVVTRREALRITALAGISLAFAGGLTAAVVRRAGLQRVSATRTQLGTLVNVTVIHPDIGVARGMVESAFAEIERLEGILSRHRPSTALARLNREGSVHAPPGELVEVTRRAVEYSALTGGAFDPTIAPLLELYGTSYARGGPPSADAVEMARSLVDYRRLQIDDARIAFAVEGMSITLDGIAKGYVVDRAAAALIAGGAGRVMVEAGGDIASGGLDDGDEGWRVAIQDPHDPAGTLGVLRLRGDCVATSGDYMQAFTEDRLLHHILDPRTGRSPERTSGVTIIAPTAMDADALATAVFVLAPEEGVNLLDRLDGVEGMIVTRQQESFASQGFERFLA